MRPRGVGSLFRPVYTRGGKLHTCSTWSIKYSVRGRLIKESTHSTRRTDAVKLLRRRLGEVGRGKLVGPDVEKTTFDDLVTMLLNDYRANGRRSLDRVEDAVAHLRASFGLDRALDISADRIIAYAAARQDAGAAASTINKELSALKRAFKLAEIAGRVDRCPHIAMLREANARVGFFEPQEFDAVLAHLPEYLRAPIVTAYVTGWRIKSEILTRHRHHLDLAAGWLRLEPGEAKNGEGRQFPLTPELRTTLEAQLARTRAVEQRTGAIIPWLFHHDDGRPVRSFRRAWHSACKKAGVPGRIPHDFRRTAVRNLERAGVPRSVAMKLVGHKTEAIYRRYAIVSESDLREGVAKLAALHAAASAGGRTVVSLPETPLAGARPGISRTARGR